MRRVLAGAALTVALVALAADHLTSVRSERPLRIASTGEPVSLDPLMLEGTTVFILANVFEGLVQQDRGMRIQPALAVSWMTLDDRTWSFELRSGVHFHDGSAFSAADVKTAFERARAEPEAPGKQLLGSVESLEVTGELSLRVITRAPDPLLLQRLSWFHVAKGATTRQVTTNPVGTGPYKFVRWERGRRFELAAFDGYWGGAPPARRVEIVPLAPDARIEALRRGDIDIAGVPGAALEIRTRPPVRLIRARSLTRMFLWLGGRPREHARNPLADQRVRRAVALALDRNALSGALVGDPHMAAFQLVPKTIFGYAPQLEEQHQDLAEARRLLAEAGFRGGFEAPMIHGSDPLAARTASLVSEMLSAVGVRTSPRAATKEEVLAALGGQATGFLVERWTYDDADAGSFLRDCVHSRDAARDEGLFNPGFSDPAMDRLIEASLTLLDARARLGRYHEIMQRAADAVPAVPLFDQPYVYGLAAGLEWTPRLDGAILAADVTPDW